MKIGLYIAAALAALSIGGGIYWKIYRSGAQSVEIEAERKLTETKEKTNAAKTDALVAEPDDVDKRLHERYSRPD